MVEADQPLVQTVTDAVATAADSLCPRCDVFELEDGKIVRFDCYPEGSVIFAQLGVLINLEAALTPQTT